jgi:hypothetical protein
MACSAWLSAALDASETVDTTDPDRWEVFSRILQVILVYSRAGCAEPDPPRIHASIGQVT